MRLSLSAAALLAAAPLLFAQQPAKPPAVNVPEGVVFERESSTPTRTGSTCN